VTAPSQLVSDPSASSAHSTAGPAPLTHPLLGEPLSRREFEVLAVYARVAGIKGVSATLQIRACTVKNHMSSAYRKLGVDNVIEAFAELGWLRVPVEIAA
jgi:DNA-binding NarL/FixJ family response regulator